MHVIISNYGNDSIALIEWAYEHKLKNITVIAVDTAWQAPEWHARTSHCQQWLKSLGFTPITLPAKAGFAELVRNRGSFPSRKFQWCAGFLKGLPINAWLEQVDPQCKAILLIARRRAASRAQANLPEFIEESEHFGERRVWHPLYLHTHQQRDNLLKRAGFAVLNHRSLECDPCVNSDANDVSRMSPAVLTRAAILEQELNSKMLDPELYGTATDLQNLLAKPATCTNHYELFDMGCGSVFGCGL